MAYVDSQIPRKRVFVRFTVIPIVGPGASDPDPHRNEAKMLSKNLTRIYLWGMAFFVVMFVLMVRLLPVLATD